jgi:LacI family transcriptional regulator
MPVRMKDIAKDLGLSIVTVSKVLRDHPDISAETRDRVRRRMKEVNYRPNLAARALVTGRTCSVGLVVPDLVHPFFGEVAKGMSRVLRKKGYNLMISSSEEDPELESREVEQLLARSVDALILASTQNSLALFARLLEHQTPYILIDRTISGLKASFIGVDDVSAGRIATEHLISTGRRVIAHIGGPPVSTAIGRMEGYRRSMAAHGIKLPPEYVITRERGDEASDRTGHDAMKRLLALKPRPDGVFCYNDPTAMGAMEAVIAAGLRIPRDVAIVGCGNVRYAAFLRVPLTSIDQQSEEIGDRAAKLALQQIEAKGTSRTKTILLQPKLVMRESSCAG